ncbi:unnamed protein product [Paramecium octaurelia]|uniref:Uncharacterized protein n=1 Tax=Paramecium octaurelia TaxID=43137 RepID=A0A8S1UIU5_PAROT|nr:unnamed protein product [Paramecium octaurelia]
MLNEQQLGLVWKSFLEQLLLHEIIQNLQQKYTQKQIVKYQLIKIIKIRRIDKQLDFRIEEYLFNKYKAQNPFSLIKKPQKNHSGIEVQNQTKKKTADYKVIKLLMYINILWRLD